MLVVPEGDTDVSKNPVVKMTAKYMNVTKDLHGQKFFVRQPHPTTGKLVMFATPLFVALIVINFADLIFAVDLGARDLPDHDRHLHRLHREHHGDPGPAGAVLRAGRAGAPLPLSEVCAGRGLIFIGLKGFYSYFFGKFDPYLSLAITIGIIAAGIFYSLWKTRDGEHKSTPAA